MGFGPFLTPKSEGVVETPNKKGVVFKLMSKLESTLTHLQRYATLFLLHTKVILGTSQP